MMNTSRAAARILVTSLALLALCVPSAAAAKKVKPRSLFAVHAGAAIVGHQEEEITGHPLGELGAAYYGDPFVGGFTLYLGGYLPQDDDERMWAMDPGSLSFFMGYVYWPTRDLNISVGPSMAYSRHSSYDLARCGKDHPEYDKCITEDRSVAMGAMARFFVHQQGRSKVPSAYAQASMHRTVVEDGFGEHWLWMLSLGLNVFVL